MVYRDLGNVIQKKGFERLADSMKSFNFRKFVHSILYHASNVLTEAVKNKIRHLCLVESHNEHVRL
jgi:hypothetical protein